MKSAFKTGDIVKVLSGEEKGKTGKVLRIDRKKNLVLVEGINQMTHYTRKSEKTPNGGMLKKEGFLPACKVAKEAAAKPADKKEKKDLPKKK